MQKTGCGSAGRAGRSPDSSPSGDCPRDRTSCGANRGAPCSLAGHLPGPPCPWTGLGSQTDALIDITLGSL